MLNVIKGDSGQALVELALMAPWIFFLFMAVFDFGFYAYASIATANAARVAALYTSSSTSSTVVSALNDNNVCSLVRGELSMLPNISITQPCGASPLTVTYGPVTGPDGVPASSVRVTYQTIPLIPVPGLMSQLTISRMATMRIAP